MSETIRTEQAAVITRNIEVGNTPVIVKEEKSDHTFLIVIDVLIFFAMSQGGGAGCQRQGRGGYQGGHGGHGGRGNPHTVIVK